jgi:ubiquinone/menaquinone biosynthesis C-methylase UbiE
VSRLGLLAPVYDRLTGPAERRAFGSWRRRTWAEVPRAGPGLEIGAGTGANFPYHPPGTRVLATDLSPAMLQRARRKPESAAVPLAAADALALPFRDGTFAWAVATLVFCEVPDPVGGLREVRRVLAPGGRLVLLEHVRPSGWLGVLADAATLVTAPLLGEHFDRDTEAAVRQAGFELEGREWLWRDGVVLLTARAPAHPAR